MHSHLFRADIYANLAAGGLVPSQPRLVSTRHNDDRFFLNPFIGLMHYLLSARQDMIIAISDHVARFTIARGVHDATRVRRVYHGLDSGESAALDSDGQRLRSELGLSSEAFLVGNVGRLAPQKGQRHLVGAMPMLVERVPRAHLAIVGGGDLEPYLRDLAREVGVSDHVHVLGPRKDVPAFMHAIDAFAMPSIWEGFGIVLLEAMAAARPIVASRVATIPEVVEDGETGLLVPPGDAVALADALAWLAGAPAEARAMGEAGRAAAAHPLLAAEDGGGYRGTVRGAWRSEVGGQGPGVRVGAQPPVSRTRRGTTRRSRPLTSDLLVHSRRGADGEPAAAAGGGRGPGRATGCVCSASACASSCRSRHCGSKAGQPCSARS